MPGYTAYRAPMSHLLFEQTRLLACGRLLPQCSDWHVKCLVRGGL